MVGLHALISVLLLSEVHGQDFDRNIECPFPEGQDVSSETECNKYSSCVWQDAVCSMKGNSEAGYVVTSGPHKTSRGFKLLLEKVHPELTLFDRDVKQLTFEVISHEDYHVQVKIYDSNVSRYEVPVPLYLPETPTDNPEYNVTMSSVGEPFTFSVERAGAETGQELFSMVGALTFEDQFLQITTALPTAYLYGMGENTHMKLKHTFQPRQTYPIFARDHGIEEGILNVYGHHPYFVNVNNATGKAHSVLLFNSNAMEYSTFLLENGSPALTLRTIGGVIDLHLFLGPSLEDVNKQYTKMIGYPVLPPYWSLGFQLSRWGYNNTNHVRELRKRTKAMGIPQDGQTLDIDYMDGRQDFTIDPVNWGDLPDLVDELHNEGIKITLILDPGIVADWDSYPPGERGRDADAFIKWASKLYVPDDQDPSWADYMVGRVWPDFPTVFPDFLKPETQQWWSGELKIFHEKVPYDAIWIDMNEPANFGTNLGGAAEEGEPKKKDLQCPFNHLDSPPYPTMTVRTGDSQSKRISEHSLCMSGNQTDGENVYLHYDVHSLYGWSETVSTHAGLQDIFPGKRPLVLSRSTFVGSGHYGIHWLGDNSALWSHLKMSVVGMLEFNLFGIPMVGADICGFNLETDLELCARWTQLGAFYPFSRNHNAKGNQDQDPAMWPEVASIAREVLTQRYQYLPYLYTLFHDVHMNGGSVARPVFSQFPTDEVALEVDDQFLWGEGIMVAPVVSPGTVERDVYFPAGEWYDLRTGVKVATGPQSLRVSAPLEVIPVYAYGGIIIPYQVPALTTTESRSNPFGLSIPLDSSMRAKGELFWDDGESEHVMQETYLANITFSENTLILEPLFSSSPVAGLNLETLLFYGYPTEPSTVEVNGEALLPSQWIFEESTNVLSVQMSAPLGENITVKVS